MNITVLGNYGPYPPAGGTCSGYLLEEDGNYVLLECGNGVLSNLQHYIDIEDLSGVIVSHLHSDHVSDLFILRYAIKYGIERGKRGLPVPIFCPSEPTPVFEQLFYRDIYELNIIDEEEKVNLGPFSFSFLTTAHSVPCFAVAVDIKGVNRMVYSADTEYFSGLSHFARETPLFLCESNFLEKDKAKGTVNHLTAKQAAAAAEEAGVGRLILTHFLPFRDPRLYQEEASAIFSYPELPAEGITYTV